MAKLLNCPFTGKAAETETVPGDLGNTGVRVICKASGAASPVFFKRKVEGKPVEAEELAVAWWNTRSKN